jgi:hypothetical protein
MTGSRNTCQMADCDNDAEPRPVYDTNPVVTNRKVIGEETICTSCRTKIENINAKIRSRRSAKR